MSITPVLWGYDDIISLQTALSVAGDGDFVYPSAPNLEILIPIGQTPLIVSQAYFDW
ncbi:MAG: hypothetical protein IPK08_03875 [Bacteroidetes bacterium]|nr:hypothetical protein [Bacteroidota bacterium]